MKIFMAFMFCMSLNSWADHHEGMNKKMDAMSFEEAKKWHTDKIQMHEKMMEEYKSCVNGAKDKDALRQCMWEKKEDKKDMKKKMKK